MSYEKKKRSLRLLPIPVRMAENSYTSCGWSHRMNDNKESQEQDWQDQLRLGSQVFSRSRVALMTSRIVKTHERTTNSGTPNWSVFSRNLRNWLWEADEFQVPHVKRCHTDRWAHDLRAEERSNTWCRGWRNFSLNIQRRYGFMCATSSAVGVASACSLRCCPRLVTKLVYECLEIV